MSKMVRRQIHLEKPYQTETIYVWVDEEKEAQVADHEAMKNAINPVYRMAFDLCPACVVKENPEPLFCDDCNQKESE
ncbi:hypothetical protein [Actinomycetia phage DSL-LC01]|nr:hypothetical protein [Actinomycetia phage DSL-LC01]